MELPSIVETAVRNGQVEEAFVKSFFGRYGADHDDEFCQRVMQNALTDDDVRYLYKRTPPVPTLEPVVKAPPRVEPPVSVAAIVPDAPAPAPPSEAYCDELVAMERRLERRFDEKLREAQQQFDFKMGDMQDMLRELLGKAKVQAEIIPPLESITKIKVQFFNNQINAGPTYKQTGPSGKAMFRLKLYIWTCPPDQIERYLEGTCGHLWINVYDPTVRKNRERLDGNLDYLDAFDAKFIGALLAKDGKKRHWDQCAIIGHDNHLYLQVRDDRIDMGFGYAAALGFAAGAHVRRWYWRPDCIPDYADEG